MNPPRQARPYVTITPDARRRARRREQWHLAIALAPVVTSALISLIWLRAPWNALVTLFLGGGVALWLWDAVLGGIASGNWGTASRARSPEKFWLQVAWWMIFYLLAIIGPPLATQQQHQQATPRQTR